MTVALVKFDGSLHSLREAIELCDGFGKLSGSDRVLIKPNNCFRHRVMPPYGMVTTSWIVDGVVQLLLEYGCHNISIGEGAIIGIFGELAPYTEQGFKGTGIEKVAKKYNVRLVDFNREAFQELDLEGTKVQVAEAALDADFLINIPVLKTHFQAKVSLGFKNMKGCLSQESKRRFHISKRLDTLICLLNEAVNSDLVIIDGIYMLEKGPETLAGVAHRKDLIIASPDIFQCDVVGATILGVDPAQVDYLREYAQRHNRNFDINAIQIKGENIESVREQLEWRFEPDEELLAPLKVTGLSAPHPGQTLCSACGATLALALSIFAEDNPGINFGGVKLYYGLESKSEEDTGNVILYGDCAVRSNKGLENAVKIQGCPPNITKTLLVLMKTLLTKPRMFRMLLLQAIRLIRMRLGVRQPIFPRWERYQSKEFDKSHF
jgi:uncharacterized protein (DUF362 family)